MRTVSEGVSDLHLSAAQRPRWRIDGEILELEDQRAMGDEEVRRLIEPVMAGRDLGDLRGTGEIECGLSVDGLARFRVHLFVDHNGVGESFGRSRARS